MQREKALTDFRKKIVHVLISTDVCARGIDIKELDHVSFLYIIILNYYKIKIFIYWN